MTIAAGFPQRNRARPTGVLIAGWALLVLALTNLIMVLIFGWGSVSENGLQAFALSQLVLNLVLAVTAALAAIMVFNGRPFGRVLAFVIAGAAAVEMLNLILRIVSIALFDGLTRTSPVSLLAPLIALIPLVAGIAVIKILAKRDCADWFNARR